MARERPNAGIEEGRLADLGDVCEILVAAFRDDPVAAWAIPEADCRGEVLHGRLELIVEACLRHGEVYVNANRSAAALCIPPGAALVGDDEAELFGKRLERVTGENAGRFFELDKRKKERYPEAPCLYLALMGVVPERQGHGLGSALLAAVLQRADASVTPTYLEATSAKSRRLYQRHGFQEIGEIALPDGPALWAMWRAPMEP